MTAQATPQRAPWWRRLFRERPFWQKRPEDFEDTRPKWSWGRELARLGAAVLEGALLILVLSGVVTIFAQVAGQIFYSPGFLEVGLAAPIGRGLAEVCQQGGSCDLATLLTSSVLGFMLFTMAGIFLHWCWRENDEQEDPVERGQASVDVLDERIVHLRADLVLAGVLKLSPEEQANLAPEEE